MNPDLFEAILGDPIHYIANLITAGWFGMICKKSKISFTSVEQVYNQIVDSIKFNGDDEYVKKKTNHLKTNG